MDKDEGSVEDGFAASAGSAASAAASSPEQNKDTGHADSDFVAASTTDPDELTQVLQCCCTQGTTINVKRKYGGMSKFQRCSGTQMEKEGRDMR